MVTQTNPNSLKNLEKGIKMTSEVAKENQKKSTEAKRLKKTMRETLEILLQDVVSVDGTPKNCQEAILASAVNKAMQGDIKAMEFIRDTVGQKPIEKQESSVRSEVTINDLSQIDTSTLLKMAKNAKVDIGVNEYTTNPE